MTLAAARAARLRWPAPSFATAHFSDRYRLARSKEVMVRVSPDEQLIDVLSRRRACDWLRHVRALQPGACNRGMVTDVLPESPQFRSFA